MLAGAKGSKRLSLTRTSTPTHPFEPANKERNQRRRKQFFMPGLPHTRTSLIPPTCPSVRLSVCPSFKASNCCCSNQHNIAPSSLPHTNGCLMLRVPMPSLSSSNGSSLLHTNCTPRPRLASLSTCMACFHTVNSSRSLA
jgi:hypothetical protein